MSSTEGLASARSLSAKRSFITALSSKAPKRWPHQQETVEFARTTPIVFDTSDPGTGKTRGHIDSFTERLAAGETEKLLVVCPKTLMGPAWADDIKKFAPYLSYSLAFAENREEAFKQDVNVYIINTDGVKWLAKKTDAWLKKTFGKDPSLIIDESTAFKNHSGVKRSSAIKRISRFFTFKTAMSGTAAPKTVTELWHQVYLLDGGKRLGRTFTGFRNATQIPIQSGAWVKWEDRDDARDVVGFLIRDISIRHEFEKVMDVPPNFMRTITYDPPKKLMKIYEELRREAIVELQSSTVRAINAAVLTNKLIQVASGAVYDGPESYTVIDDTRYELITDLLNERTHSVCFFNWKHQRDQLTRLAKARGIEHEVIDGGVTHRRRTEIVDSYQRGDLQVVYLHPQTGAHGLTLTRGIATILSSPRYEADLLKQGIHRIYRGGQTKKTETILVEARGTLETAIYALLDERTTKMKDLLTILQGD